MIITFGDLESDQATLQGELSTDIFQIETEGDIRSIGPIKCDLQTSISGEHLIVDGLLSIPAQLRCVNCLENFSRHREITDYHAQIAIENHRLVDLTEHIRDDILLDLPNYPHCTDGDLPDHICPSAGPFSYENKGAQPQNKEEKEEQEPDIWAALEDLKPKDD
ncbi:MAG: DUF177 domain-containing protein [Verrucomicrobiales bacterium]|nr:DUF177 domain-containing protein [Verrucomicrobiales bacterium]